MFPPTPACPIPLPVGYLRVLGSWIVRRTPGQRAGMSLAWRSEGFGGRTDRVHAASVRPRFFQEGKRLASPQSSSRPPTFACGTGVLTGARGGRGPEEFFGGTFAQRGSYLVDSASSHMLVLKIKPCMSKYKQFIRRNCEWLIKSVIVYLMIPYYMDNRGNSRANTCQKPRLREGCVYQTKNRRPSGLDGDSW